MILFDLRRLLQAIPILLGVLSQAKWGLMWDSLRQAIYVRLYVATLPGLDDLHDVDVLQPHEQWISQRRGSEAE